MPTLRIDLHTHLKVGKRCALRPGEARRFAATLRERNLHALAVTEHFHAPGFWAMYDDLLRQFPYRRGRFEVDGSLFFVGAELTLAERADVVLLTTLPDLKAIDLAFPTPLSAGYHPSAAELNHALCAMGALAVRVAAHPSREGKGLDNLDPTDAAELFHAAEINARFCEASAVRAAKAFARDAGAQVVGGSDAHVYTQVGAAWTEIEFAPSIRPQAPRRASATPPPPDVSFDDLRDALLSPAPERVLAAIHPDAERLCAEGAELKASLKAALPRIEPVAVAV